MVNRSKRKGTDLESRSVKFLQENGFPGAMRHPLYGTGDRGDIAGVPEWTLQCKNHTKMDLGVWCSGAEQQAKNGKTRFWAVIHNRRSHSVAENYATLPFHMLVELIQHYHPELDEEDTADQVG